MTTTVLVTGGFDPLHSGHLKLFKAARALGDRLVVGLNSDAWLTRKKGRAFMPITERSQLVESIKGVDAVILFNDDDGSACEAVRNALDLWPNDHIIFANGGDRTQHNVPEMTITDLRLTFAFGIGGSDKANSSSWILEEWRSPKTPRPWGYYRVLHDVKGLKAKELTIEPGQSLSLQRHEHRSEFWMVSEGQCTIYSQMPGGYQLPPKILGPHDSLFIGQGQWHQLANPFDQPCRIVELQYGSVCEEWDIERR